MFQHFCLLGEAAGIAMGLVMLGSKSSQAIDDMVMVCIISYFMIWNIFVFICSIISTILEPKRIGHVI